MLQFLVGILSAAFISDRSTASQERKRKRSYLLLTIEMDNHAHARSFPAMLQIGKPVQTTYECSRFRRRRFPLPVEREETKELSFRLISRHWAADPSARPSGDDMCSLKALDRLSATQGNRCGPPLIGPKLAYTSHILTFPLFLLIGSTQRKYCLKSHHPRLSAVYYKAAREAALYVRKRSADSGGTSTSNR
jgi:hypothetical protein